jgi:predicted nucleic acid binding AN1-type Zn finger protein
MVEKPMKNLKNLNKIFLRIIGWCPYCRTIFHYPKRRRMNTQYAKEESNWVTCCKPQFDEIQEYWKERWADYWSDRF